MTTETETIDVDINGVSVKLPKEIGEKVIKARDADKGKMRELNEKYGKLEADKTAAEVARQKAEDDKQAIELAKKGEVEQVRNLLTKDFKDRESKLSAKARDKHLAALVAGNENIIKGAIPDIVEALKGRTQYNFDTESVTVTDAAGLPQKDTDGNPVSVDAFISGWLEKRPHYLLDKTQKGSGGEGDKKQTGKVLTEEAFGSLSTKDKAKFFADGGKIAGVN